MDNNKFYFKRGLFLNFVCEIPYFFYFLHLFFFVCNQNILFNKDNLENKFNQEMILIFNLLVFASIIPIMATIFVFILKSCYEKGDFRPGLGKLLGAINFCFYTAFFLKFGMTSFFICFFSLVCIFSAIVSIFSFFDNSHC